MMDNLVKMDIQARGVVSRLQTSYKTEIRLAHADGHHLQKKKKKSLAGQRTPGTGQLTATCEK